MTMYDAAMALVVVAGMVRGAWRGFTWQAASIASLVLGYTTARSLSGQLAASFPGEPEVQRVLAMAVIYLAVSGGVFGIAWMVRGTLRKLKFDAYDRHLGTLLGGLEGVGVGLLLTLFVVSLAPTTRRPIFASPSGRLVGGVMNGLGPVLPGEVRNVLAPLWDGGPADPADATAPAVAAGDPGAHHAEAAPTPPSPAAPAPAEPAPASGASLPAIEEAVTEAASTPPPATAALPPLEAPAQGQAAVAGGGTLDGLVERAGREVAQAVAGTLDATGAKARDLRQTAVQETRRLQGAVGKTGKDVGRRVQDRVGRGQQQVERAITKGQQQVERAISSSVDEAIRHLGIEAAPQKGPQ